MKNKKVFFYCSCYFFFFVLSFTLFAGVGIYGIIFSLTELINRAKGLPVTEDVSLSLAIIGCLSCFILIFAIIFEIILILRNMIFVNEFGIYNNLSIKIKFKNKVALCEINKIDLVFEYRQIRKRVEIYHKKHAFLVIYNLNERAKYFDVNYYSRKQVIKIIDAIRERMQQVGNSAETLSGEELMKNFEDKNDKYIYRISGGFLSK